MTNLRFPTEENAHDWMPSLDQVLPSRIDLLEIPFASLSKMEKLGRIADWTALDHQQPSRKNQVAREEDEDGGWSFSLTETKTTLARKGIKAPRGPAPVVMRSGLAPPGRGGQDQRRNSTRGGRQPWGGMRQHDRIQRHREPSVLVKPAWKMLEEIEFARLYKLQLDPDATKVLCIHGALPVYDRVSEKITTKTEKLVVSTSSIPALLPLAHDPSFARLAVGHPFVLCTSDTAASLLMVSTRTLIPWDLVLEQRGNIMYLDKRPDSPSDLIHVNETANDPPSDANEHRETPNSAHNLALEATRLHYAVPAALSKPEDPIIYQPETAENTATSSTLAYRYVQWNLGQGTLVIVRSEINAVARSPTALVLTRLQTLLEYDTKSSISWRQSLDVQRGAVLATEIRNNSALLSRWVFQALLADISSLKLVYASRISAKDTSRHAILAVQDFDPYDLSTQMNLNVPNGFGILRAMTDLCRKHQETTSSNSFILVRDPNKPILRLYATAQ